MAMHYYDFVKEFVSALAKRLNCYVEVSVEDYVEEWALWVDDFSLYVEVDYNDFEDFVHGECSSFVIECEDYRERHEFVVECASTDVSFVADVVADAFGL